MAWSTFGEVAGVAVELDRGDDDIVGVGIAGHGEEGDGGA